MQVVGNVVDGTPMPWTRAVLRKRSMASHSRFQMKKRRLGAVRPRRESCESGEGAARAKRASRKRPDRESYQVRAKPDKAVDPYVSVNC
jgi:hypothetical protein